MDSAVAEFILHEQIDERIQGHETEFLAFVRAAYSMKRKTLVNNLKCWNSAMLPQVEACLESCGVQTQTRAEALDVSQLIALFMCLHTHHDPKT